MNGWWRLRDGGEAGGVRTGPRLGKLGPQVGGGAAEVRAGGLSVSLPTPCLSVSITEEDKPIGSAVATFSLIFSTHINGQKRKVLFTVLI